MSALRTEKKEGYSVCEYKVIFLTIRVSHRTGRNRPSMPPTKLRGKVHPEAKPESYNGFYLTRSEMEQQVKDVIGTPLQDEHNDKIVIGKITNAWINDKEQMEIEGEIYRDVVAGNRVINKIRRGEASGLSLGMNHKLDTQTLNVFDKKIKEISVVDTPDYEGAKIDFVENDSPDFVMAQKYLELSGNVRNLEEKIYKDAKSLFNIPSEQGRRDIDRKSKMASPQETQTTPMQVTPTQPLPPHQQAANLATQSSNPPTQATQAVIPPKPTIQTSESITLTPEQFAKYKKIEDMQLSFEEINKNKAELERLESLLLEINQSPAQFAEEVKKGIAKRQKYIRENGPPAMQTLASVITEAGKNPDKNVLYKSVQYAEKNPEEGQQLIETISLLNQRNERRVQEIETAASTKVKNLMSQHEKDLQEYRSKTEAAEKRARDSEESVRRMTQRNEVFNHSGILGRSFLSDRTPMLTAPTHTFDTSSTTTSSSTTSSSMVTEPTIFDWAKRWEVEVPPPPSNSDLVGQEHMRIHFGLPQGKGLQHDPDVANVWNAYKSKLGPHTKGSGIGRFDLYGGRELIPLRESKQVSPNYFELPPIN